MLLARFEGVTLAPLAQADDEVEQVLALLGQDVLLVADLAPPTRRVTASRRARRMPQLTRGRANWGMLQGRFTLA
jgi:hypothetical protein